MVELERLLAKAREEVAESFRQELIGAENRVRALEEELADIRNPTRHALLEHDDEEHCACASLLSARVRALEVLVKDALRFPFIAPDKRTTGEIHKWRTVARRLMEE